MDSFNRGRDSLGYPLVRLGVRQDADNVQALGGVEKSRVEAAQVAPDPAGYPKLALDLPEIIVNQTPGYSSVL